MDRIDWPAEFEALVRAHLPDSEQSGGLDPDLDLLAAGMDSLETIGLMTDLEERFGFEFPDESLSIETFSTPRILWTAMSACLPADPSNAP